MFRFLQIAMLLTCAAALSLKAEEAEKKNVPPFEKDKAMHRHHAQGGHTNLMNKFIHELNLTEEQKSEIQEIIKKNQPLLNNLRTNMFNARKEIVEAFQSSDFDEAKLKAAWSKFSAVAEEFLLTWGKIISEVRPILTEEQRIKLNEKCQHIAGMFGGGMGMMGHKPPFVSQGDTDKRHRHKTDSLNKNENKDQPDKDASK